MKKRTNKNNWEESKIIIICGSGGVGKTSFSAALALNFAKKGHKTLVLTVDPAKRLAQAMGLDEISHEPQSIHIGKKGDLDAMMLNTKHMFDKIISKYSADDEAKQSVLGNPLYKHLSTMLAGSQEYMAMENLYEIVNEYDYDKIVVDTPPTAHALDFFDAPNKLINAITNSMIKLLIKPSLWAGKSGSRLLRKGTQKFMNIFGNIAGVQFVQELSDFLSSTINLLEGFKDRAQEVFHLINSKETAFLLITAPQQSTIDDSKQFIKEIEKRNLKFSRCILNRVSPYVLKDPDNLNKSLEWMKKEKLEKLAEKTEIKIEESNVEKDLIESLKKKNSEIDFFIIPKSYNPINNLRGLKEIYKSMQKI